jgi:hypothetical protein
MIESIFQTFILLGTFDIILISVSIANYAISASYLGRETRLTRGRMEKRKEKLEGIVEELQTKGLPIEELKKETKKAEDDITVLGTRLFFLSWLGAVILPSILFIASLVSAVIGMNSDIFFTIPQTQNPLVYGLMTTSISFLIVGFFFLLLVIGVIDSAARKIPIPEFEVFFKNHAKSISIKRNAKESIRLYIRNEGEDIAENVEVFALFPNTFEVDKMPNYSLASTSEARYPECIYVNHTMDLLHIGVLHYFTIVLTAPDEKKTYDILIDIRERKRELSRHHLSIEVVD